MQTAFEKAIELMITADPELLNILGVTAKMSLSSSLIALLLGVDVYKRQQQRRRANRRH